MSAPQKRVRKPRPAASRRKTAEKKLAAVPQIEQKQPTHYAYPTAFVEELVASLKGLRLAFNAQGLDNVIGVLTQQALAVTVEQNKAPEEDSPGAK